MPPYQTTGMTDVTLQLAEWRLEGPFSDRLCGTTLWVVWELGDRRGETPHLVFPESKIIGKKYTFKIPCVPKPEQLTMHLYTGPPPRRLDKSKISLSNISMQSKAVIRFSSVGGMDATIAISVKMRVLPAKDTSPPPVSSEYNSLSTPVTYPIGQGSGPPLLSLQGREDCASVLKSLKSPQEVWADGAGMTPEEEISFLTSSLDRLQSLAGSVTAELSQLEAEEKSLRENIVLAQTTYTAVRSTLHLRELETSTMHAEVQKLRASHVDLDSIEEEYRDMREYQEKQYRSRNQHCECLIC